MLGGGGWGVGGAIDKSSMWAYSPERFMVQRRQSSQIRIVRIYKLNAEGEGQRLDREAGAVGPGRGHPPPLEGKAFATWSLSGKSHPSPRRQLLPPSHLCGGVGRVDLHPSRADFSTRRMDCFFL